jgi:hypothetical protein
MARSIESRLTRLEAVAEGPPLRVHVVWDDEEPEPTAWVIRLRWGNDRESEDPWTRPT